MRLGRLLAGFDPLVRLLLLALLLASLFPVAEEHRPTARIVSDSAIFLLFLLNGLRLPRADMFKGVRNWRFLAPLTLWCFLGMGLAGWLLHWFGQAVLPEQVALGILFLGLLPSTVQSAAAYSSLAGGNVAASVIAAAVLNVLGVFLTAPLLAILAGVQGVGIDLAGLQRIGLILLLPFVLGQMAQTRIGHWVRSNRVVLTWADRTAIAIAVYVAFSGAVEQGLLARVDGSGWSALLGLLAVFLTIGFAGSWMLGRLLHLDRGDRIAFLFAGAQKSIALGAPLASVLFPPATAGLVLLPVLIYHLVQLMISAPIAARLARTSALPS